jgi:UDP-glucuronate 4-epimerase
MSILVTGAAGFIGFHLSKKLLDLGLSVVGYDNLNDYYDVNLKESRLEILKKYDEFTFYREDLIDMNKLNQVFLNHDIRIVVNLAAQAGVRYSIENPRTYIDSNIVGFLNILEVCRHNKVEHLLYASSSSVYGGNEKIPFSVEDRVDHPISLYAATKKSNELMAHTYSHLFGIPTTGLRFFTVYGPWGRPDMALFKFTKAIINKETIDVYNYGKMKRDFTYVDDIVENIYRLLEKPPVKNDLIDKSNMSTGESFAPYRILNIGSSKPVELMEFIRIIEEKLKRESSKNMMPLQDGDVPMTYADVDALIAITNYKPDTSIEDGIGYFIDWYMDYYMEEI